MKHSEYVKELVISVLKETYILCPDCKDMYTDNQYTCTTCWCEGGQGTLNVFTVLKENPEFIN